MIKNIALCVLCATVKPGSYEDGALWAEFTIYGRGTFFNPHACPSCWEKIEGDSAAIVRLLCSEAKTKSITICDGCRKEKPGPVQTPADDEKEHRWVAIDMARARVHADGIHLCPPCWIRGETNPSYVANLVLTAHRDAVRRRGKAKAKQTRINLGFSQITVLEKV